MAPYRATRDGANGDEVACWGVDGLCEYTWKDYGGSATPDYIAIQWTSSANNGTPGVGIWGGKPSKMVAFFLEFTRIDHVEGIDTSAIRNDILKKVIIWLLDDRDHPEVFISSPNGGEVFTTNNIQIQWSAVPTAGSGIFEQRIYYSDNGGDSWTHLSTVDNTTFQYDWDISTGVPNGNKYMIKVVVVDDGAPPLIGSDTSNATFAILRVNGDSDGPLTIPGSIRVNPHYVDSAATVWFNATVDDSNRGNATISAAEYFLQCTEPDVADYGSSIYQMTASDGSFDTPIEDVTWNGILNMPSAWYRIWVHGADCGENGICEGGGGDDNWGPFESRRFLLLDGVTPPDLNPPIPALSVDIAMQGAGNSDLNISWDASPNDDGDPANVEYYDVYYSTSFARNGTGYQLLTSIQATGVPSYSVVEAGKGNGDPNNYFFYVTARDNSCNIAQNATQLVKYIRPLSVGANLISIPLILSNNAIDSVLPTGSIEVAWWYDPSDPADHWKSYNPKRTENGLTTVTYEKALWIRATAAADVLVVGRLPAIATVSLQEGWNFVGYPSFILSTVKDALDTVAYQRVEGIGPSGLVEILGDLSEMAVGYGYWIKVGSLQTWTIQN
jgi:hypothetical protein